MTSTSREQLNKNTKRKFPPQKRNTPQSIEASKETAREIQETLESQLGFEIADFSNKELEQLKEGVTSFLNLGIDSSTLERVSFTSDEE